MLFAKIQGVRNPLPPSPLSSPPDGGRGKGEGAMSEAYGSVTFAKLNNPLPGRLNGRVVAEFFP